jgi:hypothetical protein
MYTDEYNCLLRSWQGTERALKNVKDIAVDYEALHHMKPSGFGRGLRGHSNDEAWWLFTVHGVQEATVFEASQR